MIGTFDVWIFMKHRYLIRATLILCFLKIILSILHISISIIIISILLAHYSARKFFPLHISYGCLPVLLYLSKYEVSSIPVTKPMSINMETILGEFFFACRYWQCKITHFAWLLTVYDWKCCKRNTNKLKIVHTWGW